MSRYINGGRSHVFQRLLMTAVTRTHARTHEAIVDSRPHPSSGNRPWRVNLSIHRGIKSVLPPVNNSLRTRTNKLIDEPQSFTRAPAIAGEGTGAKGVCNLMHTSQTSTELSQNALGNLQPVSKGPLYHGKKGSNTVIWPGLSQTRGGSRNLR